MIFKPLRPHAGGDKKGNKSMKIEEVIKQIGKRKVRFVVSWNTKRINFCTMELMKDGSFIFSSAFHNKDSKLEYGIAKSLDGQFVKHKCINFQDNPNGVHISLHPKDQKMHFRRNSPAGILFERKINWFPVTKPFNLLYLFSPPIDSCSSTNKKSPFNIPVPNKYKESIKVKVDIFPRETKEHNPSRDSIWYFWGICPNYLVRVSFLLYNRRVPALLFWPDSKKLSL